MMKKYLLCILAMLLLSNVPILAQTNLYKVVAGDTFERIANELNVSVDALKEANPNVRYLMVGMKLNVPDKTDSSLPIITNDVFPPKPAPQPDASTLKELEDKGIESPVYTDSNARNNRPDELISRFSGGMFFNEGELVKNSYALEFYFASRSYVADPLFLEYGLAYGIESSWANEKDYKYDAMSHSLQLPILLGASIGRDFGADVYVGPYLDFTVASKSEMEILGEKSVTRLRDLEDYNRFQLGLKIGAEFGFDVFSVGVNFSVGLTRRYKGVDSSGGKLMFYLAF